MSQSNQIQPLGSTASTERSVDLGLAGQNTAQRMAGASGQEGDLSFWAMFSQKSSGVAHSTQTASNSSNPIQQPVVLPQDNSMAATSTGSVQVNASNLSARLHGVIAYEETSALDQLSLFAETPISEEDATDAPASKLVEKPAINNPNAVVPYHLIPHSAALDGFNPHDLDFLAERCARSSDLSDALGPMAIQQAFQSGINVQSALFQSAGRRGGPWQGNALSQTMKDLLAKAYQSGRPIRVAIDEASAIILRIRQGKVSAEFLTHNPAMALMLPQQLETLKQRLLARQLPVSDLLSRHHEENNPSQNQNEKNS